MRVFYELEKEDIRSMIADKYEVGIDKVIFKGQGEYVYAQIDMSATETPVPIQVPEEKEELPDLEAVKETDDIMERLEWTFFKTDHDITDEQLVEMVKDRIKITDICRKLNFDKRAKERLYARVRKLRSEGALRGLMED